MQFLICMQCDYHIMLPVLCFSHSDGLDLLKLYDKPSPLKVALLGVWSKKKKWHQEMELLLR